MKKTTGRVLTDIGAERRRQEAKWGVQSHPDGTGSAVSKQQAIDFREICEDAFESGLGSWKHILAEEIFEALAEENEKELRKELIHVAAVAAAWIEDIDTRISEAPSTVVST